MNSDQIKGFLLLIMGKVQELIGKLIGRRSLEVAGHQLKILGKSRMAIGEAQQIIQYCMKRANRLATNASISIAK